MTSVQPRTYGWASFLSTVVLLLGMSAADPAVGQQGIFLTGLGKSAQNIDVTESGGNPTATVAITCCDPMGNPVIPMEGTASESVTNLINNLVIFTGAPPNQTKWNDLQGDEFMIPVELQLSQPRKVNYYTLTSANDSPERDPWQWRFLGTNVDNPMPSDFVLLEDRTNVDFPLRHQTQLFGPVGNTTAYKTYRFEFQTQYVAQGAANYPAGLAIPNSIQLAEVELFEDFAGGGAKLTIDRATGAITLANAGTTNLNLTGYSVTSPAGTLNSNTWTSIADTADGDSGGTLDSDKWIELTPPNGRQDLSEVESPNGTGGVSIAPAGSLNLGNAWIKYPVEDLSAEILLADGSTQSVSVTFTGGPGAPYRVGDLNFSGGATPINAADWVTFKNNQSFNFSTVFSAAESYGHGDLDGDFDQDLDDFGLFKAAYDAANGAGAFVSMLSSVPEPTTAMLFAVALVMGLSRILRRRGTAVLLVGLIVLFVGFQPSQAQVVLPGLIGGDLTNADNAGPPDVVITAGDSANSPAAEMPPQAVDNNVNTKWLAFQPNGTFYQMQFRGQNRSAVNSYTLTSANDAPERDPYGWTLSGSNDGANFTVVDTRTNQTFANRFETQQFQVPSNTTEYNVYKFDFQTQLGAGGPNPGAPTAIQLAEIELFGSAFVPYVLTLEVNAATGALRIANNLTDAPVAFDAYRILSPSGALNRDNWWGGGPTGGANGGQSIHDQNIAGFPVGLGTGSGWEEGPGSSDKELTEWYLGPGGVGSSTLSPGQAITMNGVFRPGGAQDLTFEYHIAGDTIHGIVQYIGTPVGVTGDYNGNGTVDAADYVLWRNGGTGGMLQNDPTPGVQAGDYNVWRANFGRMAGGPGLAASAAVPEPTGWLLAMLAPGLLCAVCRRRPTTPLAAGDKISKPILRRNAMAISLERSKIYFNFTTLAAVFMLLVNTAAAVTVDRDYKFGDDPQEHATVGQVVGSGAGNVSPGHTLDSAAQGSFFDLQQHASPTYVSTQATGRPGASASEKGIQFTGSSSQYLDGSGFGSPQEGGVLANPPIDSYPNNRVMQIWARPTLNNGARQDVISDTFQFGVFVSPGGTWGHTYGGSTTTFLGADFVTTAPVVYNQWNHVMQQTFGNTGVALYVNGVAVDRRNANYNVSTGFSGDQNLYVGAASGGSTSFFTGQVDNAKIGVYGTFVPGPPAIPIPVDWGSFNLGTDNEYIASLNLVAGDVNGDGIVNGDGNGPATTDDVRFFIDHWLNERRVNNIVIGDLVSRTTMGDLNYDGRTTLADWSILRGAHAGGASLNLAALLGASVPEPSTILLGAWGLLGTCAAMRRNRARNS